MLNRRDQKGKLRYVEELKFKIDIWGWKTKIVYGNTAQYNGTSGGAFSVIYILQIH
jgi:hypothetical protein